MEKSSNMCLRCNPNGDRPSVVVLSDEDAAKQVGRTSQADMRFREDVVTANRALADGYGRLFMKEVMSRHSEQGA